MPLSAAADPAERAFDLVTILRHLDLLALLAALPIFIALDAPLLAYAVVAGAWIAGRLARAAADRHRARALANQNRNAALGVTMAAMLGRVWVLAGAILAVGLIDRDSGLPAALLAAAVVTFYLAGEGISHLIADDEETLAR